MWVVHGATHMGSSWDSRMVSSVACTIRGGGTRSKGLKLISF